VGLWLVDFGKVELDALYCPYILLFLALSEGHTSLSAEFCVKMLAARRNKAAASCDFERLSAILSVCLNSRSNNVGIIRDK
jgi:hypothetical protein